jgi:hypothetical protein
MARCILALYRSAVQPAMANLGRRLADTERRPGLDFIPTEDHFVGRRASTIGGCLVRAPPSAADALIAHSGAAASSA